MTTFTQSVESMFKLLDSENEISKKAKEELEALSHAINRDDRPEAVLEDWERSMKTMQSFRLNSKGVRHGLFNRFYRGFIHRRLGWLGRSFGNSNQQR